MTDVRAKQIRDALTAELQEMEEKIIADVEKTTSPKVERRQKSSSFTEAQSQGRDMFLGPGKGRGSGSGPAGKERYTGLGQGRDHVTDGLGQDQDLLEYEMAILGEAEAGVLYVAEGNKPPSGPGATKPPLPPPTSFPCKSPPAQPKRFLNSAGPRRTFHEAGSASSQKRESPSAVRRRGSGVASARRRPGSPLPMPGSGEVKDAPAEAQKAYGTKLPRRDIKIPVMPKTNLTRRPVSEQSERVKKNPDLPLPKYES